MQDSYYEQFIKAEKSVLYQVVSFIMKVSIVLAFVYFIFTSILGILGLILSLLCVIIYIGFKFLKRKIYIDYEYDFTNGEIDIITIGDKIKRKLVLNFQISEVQLLGPKDSDEIKDFSNKPTNVVRAHAKDTKEKVYTAFIDNGANKVQLDFIPNKEFLDLCFHKNPRAVKRGF